MSQKKTSNNAQDKCALTIGEVALVKLLDSLRCGNLEAVRIALSDPEISSMNLLDVWRKVKSDMQEFDAIIAKEQK